MAALGIVRLPALPLTFPAMAAPSSPHRMRILITDDHATTRVGIRQILQEAFPGAVFGEAGTAAATFAELKAGSWNVLILDLTLPDSGGLEVLRTARQLYPHLPVLVFSVHPSEQFAAQAVLLGAAGYLSKERAPEELAAAVSRIVAGGTYTGAASAGSRAAPAERPLHEDLSDREFQVLRMLVAGFAIKRIAAELVLSPKSVCTYRRRVLDKLNLESNADLVRYALRHRLTD